MNKAQKPSYSRTKCLVIAFSFAFAMNVANADDIYWVWTNNTSTAAQPADWNAATNWSTGRVPSNDRAIFSSAYSGKISQQRYIRVPDAGIKIPFLQNTTKSKTALSYLLGGDLDVTGYLNGADGGSGWGFRIFNDIRASVDSLTLQGRMIFYGTLSSKLGNVSISVHSPVQVLGRKASSSDPLILNPIPTNSVSGAYGIIIVAPQKRAASIVEGCVLTAGSPIVTGASLNAIANLTAGQVVTCGDCLKEGTFIKAIYAADCIELSAAPLSAPADPVALSFAAYSPVVRQSVAKWSTGVLEFYRPSADVDFTIETRLSGSQAITAGSGAGVGGGSEDVPYAAATYANLRLKPGDYSGTLNANKVGTITLATNELGQSGISTNPNAKIRFYDTWTSTTLTINAEENLMALPVGLTAMRYSSNLTKKGPGLAYFRICDAFIKGMTLSAGPLRLGSKLADGSAVGAFKFSADTSLFADGGATLTITNANTQVVAMKDLSVCTNATLTMRTAKELKSATLRMEEGATLKAYANTADTLKAMTVDTLRIAGTSTLEANVTVSDGLEVALDAEHPTPGCLTVDGTLALPASRTITVTGVSRALSPGRYEILKLADGDLPNEPWTCVSESDVRRFKASVVNGVLVLDVIGRGMILLFCATETAAPHWITNTPYSRESEKCVQLVFERRLNDQPCAFFHSGT